MVRLIYKSDSTVPMNWRNVGGILAKSTRNNDRDSLTGALLVGKKHFLQVLEGDFEAVNRTFQRILRDKRHRNVRLIEFGAVESRLFPEWEMRGVGVFEFDPPLSAPLVAKYGEEDGALRFPEQGWRALALIEDIFNLHDVPLWRDDPES